ncbi:adenylyltransferase/sulfurtransferase [Ureibacillus xyleni]|uniref:Adenylyltransferase/sulfurtransferase n=1 Tax=Ureibacillus xyleni TaxID=614648 RepID=A0A285RZ28_9BACL|nr:ThiF family adenylyltransferase [Ureibacillus xyleni]SOB99818.1 adenylyltransferase/sulfurtransferase [Ureibacillus xyleni]
MDTRFSRQLLFKGIGQEGQQRLEKSKVAIIGCGALGSSVLETLVRAGIGTIHIADRDVVELSNLHRQQLFSEYDALEQLPKVIAAEKRIKAIRSDFSLHTYIQHVDSTLIQQLAQQVDIIVDATDNFETRLLINDAAYKYNIPWIYGACIGSSGVVFPFIPNQSACLRCLLPVLPSTNETCDTVGIISPAVQITAAIQSAEVLKWLTGQENLMLKKIYHFDCWNSSQLNIGVSKVKKPLCKTCSNNPAYPSLQVNLQQHYAVLCGRDAVQILPSTDRKITLQDAAKIANKLNVPVKQNPYFVEFKKENHRIIVFQDGRILIHGLKNIHESRKMVTQLFG